MSFWVHQVVEYVLALALIMQATDGGRMAPAVAMGGVLLLVAATADGPLSGWKAVSRPTHRILDAVVAAVLAGIALVPGTGVDAQVRIITGMIALAMGFLLWRTDYSPTARRARRERPDAEGIGRAAGRMVGRGVRAYQRRGGPAAEGAAPEGAAPDENGGAGGRTGG